LPDELQACDAFTQRQIAVLQPKLIVTLGRYSMARFIGQGPMRDLHGRTREWNGITCLAMYHPAAILRTPTLAMRRIYEDDFRKIPPLLADARQRRAARLAASTAAEDRARQPDQLPLF
jgi:DNA polymerase